MARTVPQRQEVPIESTWAVESIFATDHDWERAVERVNQELPDLERFKGHLGDHPDRLADYLEAESKLIQQAGHIFVYSNMRHDSDTANQQAKALNDRSIALFSRVSAATSFAEPEIIAIGFDTLRRWTREHARLTIYDHYFDSLQRRQEHVRSAEVEEALGLVQDPFTTASSTHQILADTDLTFRPARTSGGEEIQIAQGNIGTLLTDTDREVRRTAWENYADAHLALKNTMSNCLSAGVKQDVFRARVRRYSSALEAALSPENIPTSVFYNLIETYKRHLPTWHRYWSVRRRGLGYDKLHEYDVHAPLTTHVPQIPYEQSVDWVVEGMRPLGGEYADVLRRGATAERWVDIYPNQGKASGAYSTGWPGTRPFILMSYDDTVFSMSTLAHEMGHSLHSYFSWKTQPLVYSDYATFVAEVASNFNQALVRAHLLGTNPDSEFQIALIEEAMSNFHRYFFVMPTLARFELDIHERIERGEALSADDMIELMAGLFGEGYGDEVEMDTERIGITWAEFSTHLYGNFYVFQYATGISAAHALAQGVLEGGAEAAERYLSFLRSGSSLYPMDALALAGVDMTSPEPVEKTFGVLAQLVDRLDELLQQRSPVSPGPSGDERKRPAEKGINLGSTS